MNNHWVTILVGVFGVVSAFVAGLFARRLTTANASKATAEGVATMLKSLQETVAGLSEQMNVSLKRQEDMRHERDAAYEAIAQAKLIIAEQQRALDTSQNARHRFGNQLQAIINQQSALVMQMTQLSAQIDAMRVTIDRLETPGDPHATDSDE